MYHKKLLLTYAAFVTYTAPLLGSLRVINVEQLLKKSPPIDFTDRQVINAFEHYALHATNNLKRLCECFAHICHGMKSNQKLPQAVAALKAKVDQRIITSIHTEALQGSTINTTLDSFIKRQKTLEPLYAILELLEKARDKTDESINKTIKLMRSKTLNKIFFLALQNDQALENFLHFLIISASDQTALLMHNYLQTPNASKVAQKYPGGDTRLSIMRQL